MIEVVLKLRGNCDPWGVRSGRARVGNDVSYSTHIWNLNINYETRETCVLCGMSMCSFPRGTSSPIFALRSPVVLGGKMSSSCVYRVTFIPTWAQHRPWREGPGLYLRVGSWNLGSWKLTCTVGELGPNLGQKGLWCKLRFYVNWYLLITLEKGEKSRNSSAIPEKPMFSACTGSASHAQFQEMEALKHIAVYLEIMEIFFLKPWYKPLIA